MAMQEKDMDFERNASAIKRIDPRKSSLENLAQLAQACIFGPERNLSISICRGKIKVKIPIPEALAIVPLNKQRGLVSVIACAMYDADTVTIIKAASNFDNPPLMNN
ncbi:MAG: hypothetical protein WD992_01485 [Candidatus Levyibacteriota bacterium]